LLIAAHSYAQIRYPAGFLDQENTNLPGTYTVNAPSHWDRFLGCQFYHVFGPAGYGTNSLETTGADIEQTDVSQVEAAIFIVSCKIGELKRRHEECGGQNLTM